MPVLTFKSIPPDALTLMGLVGAFSAAFFGYPLAGLCLATATLLGYLLYLARSTMPTLLYRPIFRHWFGILALWVGALVVGRGARFVPMIATGGMMYHFACICLYERTVRYVPWGTGFSWRTVRSYERPVIYWGFTAWFSVLGLSLLLCPLVVLCVEKTEPDAAPNGRPPLQSPASPEVQSSDSLRTSFSGGCG